MATSPLAGKPAPASLLIDVDDLVRRYHQTRPDPADPRQRVSFGTSGHRGTSLDGTFTEAHILAITQAIAEYRKSKGIDGPLYLGRDTHALSAPAQETALEVLAANGVQTVVSDDAGAGRGATPTPVVSWCILTHNRGRTANRADGIVITPSHNPPADGGFKYNPPNGGPADTDVTNWVQDRANALMAAGNRDVRRTANPRSAPTTHAQDLVNPYVDDLATVVDLHQIAAPASRSASTPSAAPAWATGA